MGDNGRKGEGDSATNKRKGRATAVIGGRQSSPSTPSPLPMRQPKQKDLIADRFGVTQTAIPALVDLPGETTPILPNGRCDGKYLFGQELGRGGMGQVFAARDVELGRTIAMKTLQPELLALEDQVSALVFEARISGQLEHPHIVPVHEMGTLDDGSVYYTMKLTGKTTLEDSLRDLRDGKAEQSIIGLLQLLRGICMAMQYAHDRGVIHRDLKPANILMGEYGEVQIMDWGVARVLPTEVGGDALFAGMVEPPGVVVGTPHYMSPEQAMGDNANVAGTSDIYSIGLILYQMLTLRLPYDAETAEEQLEALLNAPIPRPSERAPGREIPPELESICMKALSRKPSDRFASTRDLWREIAEFIEGKKDEERLRRLASAQVGRADEAAARYYLLRQRMKRLHKDVRGATLAASHFEARQDRQSRWQQKLEADHHRLVEARAFAEAVAGYHQALAYERENLHARQSLAALYRSQSEDAYQRGDDATMILYGDLERTLVGTKEGLTVNLSVRSYPEGASIRLYELTGREELNPEDAEDLGIAPFANHHIAPGSYLLSAQLPGCRENRIPIVVHENERREVLVTLKPWSADAPLFGHQDEFTTICDAFESCLATGKLAGVLLLGEAGAGKSHLMVRFDEYIDELPESIAFAHAISQKETRQVPFGAASQIMRHRAGIGLWDTPDEIRAKMDHTVRMLFTHNGRKKLSEPEQSHMREVSRLVSTMPGLCGASARLEGEVGVEFTKRVFGAAVSLFEQLSHHAPLLLKIRGADNIDRLTRDLLTFLALQLRDRPIFFLGTAQADSAELRVHRPLTLNPLNAAKVGHQVSVLLGGAISAPVRTLIHGLSLGNPSVTADLTRHFRRKGWLRLVGRKWVLCEDEEILTWLMTQSPSVGDIMMTKLDDLSDSATALLEQASVAGSRFFEGELQARLKADLTKDLLELRQADLIAQLPVSRIRGTEEFAFRHDVIRRSLYKAMPPALRQASHTAVAAWLDEHGSKGLETALIRAEHFVKAGSSELAEPLLGMITAEAALWENADAPPWFTWPEDARSGVFTQLLR
jgi:hypothetical protein